MLHSEKASSERASGSKCDVDVRAVRSTHSGFRGAGG